MSVVATAVLVATACGAAPADSFETPGVFAELSDYRLVIDQPSIAAGHVVFGIRSRRAATVHEFKVIRTDLAPDQLPIDAASAKASEDGKVGELLNVAAGSSGKLALDLVPGMYVLMCNVAGHYQLGMRVGFEVESR